jgi:hypothetical protein
MSPFERDTHEHTDPPGDDAGTPGAASGSTSDAEDAAAVIAKLVARSTGSLSTPGPSSVASADATVVQPPMPAGPATQRFEQPATPRGAEQLTQRFEQPVAPRGAEPDRPKYRHAARQPSLKILLAAGALAVLVIVGFFAFSRPATSAAKPPPVSQASVAPAVYAVQVSDVITDCASHSHGRTKTSFQSQNCVKATRFLASGQVRGRPVLFVVSQIQMASADAAASIKQVLDSNGTGNLNNLLLEGKTFSGAPAKMPDSGYASVQTGAVVVVAEAGFDDGGASSNTNPALRAAAAQVAALVKAKG